MNLVQHMLILKLSLFEQMLVGVHSVGQAQQHK